MISMDSSNEPTYRDIADLFGIQLPDGEPELTEEEKDATPTELGYQRLLEGQYEKAIQFFRKAVEDSAGGSPDAFLDLAAAYSVGEMLPQAYRQYLQAKRLNDENPEPHLGLADVLRREGKWTASLAELERVMALEPQNPYPHYKMAEVLASVGHREAAITAIQQAIFRAPDQAFYHFWMAEILIELKRFDEAIDALRAAVELSPGDDYLYVKTAVAFWGAGRGADAVKAATLASDLNPDNLALYGLLHRFHLELGQPEDAAQLTRKSAKMDDYDKDKLLRLLRDCGLKV